MRATSMVVVLISLLAVIPSRTQTKDIGDIEAIQQVEQTMGSAMVAGDVEKLTQIYADNFATIGSDGKLVTKQLLLTDFDSFHDRLEWFENGPMDVQVFGDVALAQGLVKEKRSRDGKDTSGEFLWQDVLQRRAGKWVVWRSAAARVVSAGGPNAQSQDPAVVAAIEKFENDLGDAMVAGNIGKISQAYADDWATVASSGEMFTKQRRRRPRNIPHEPMQLVVGRVIAADVRIVHVQNERDGARRRVDPGDFGRSLRAGLRVFQRDVGAVGEASSAVRKTVIGGW